MFSDIRACRYFAPSAACLVRQLVLSRRGRSLVVSAMIRLMHQLASAKQRRPDVLSWAMRPRRLLSGGLRQHRSSGRCLSLGGHIPHPLLMIAPRIPHPLATVAAWRKRGTLLAGTIPLLGVILEHFRTKQVDEKFDLSRQSRPRERFQSHCHSRQWSWSAWRSAPWCGGRRTTYSACSSTTTASTTRPRDCCSIATCPTPTSRLSTRPGGRLSCCPRPSSGTSSVRGEIRRTRIGAA